MTNPQNADQAYRNMVIQDKLVARQATLQSAQVQQVTASVASVNELTADAIASNVFVAAAGSADAPSYTFGDDLTTGGYLVEPGRFGVAAGGTPVMSFESTGVASVAHTLALPSGAAAAPPCTFGDDATTGMYLVEPGSLGFAAGGTAVMSFHATGAAEVANTLVLPSTGTAAAPPLTFAGDSNTGIFRAAADSVAISSGGTAVLTTTPTTVTVSQPLELTATQSFGPNTFVSNSDIGTILSDFVDDVAYSSASVTRLGNMVFLLLSGAYLGVSTITSVGTLVPLYRPPSVRIGGVCYQVRVGGTPSVFTQQVRIQSDGRINVPLGVNNLDEFQVTVMYQLN